jgi:excisionase family DNA binding protein
MYSPMSANDGEKQMPKIPAEQVSPYNGGANHFGRIAHSIEDVARVTSCGRTIIYEEIKAGRLMARKLGRRTVVLDSDLQAWLANLPPLHQFAAA